MEKIKGRMAVYSAEHRLLEQRIYYTSAGMKKIMSDWMSCKVISASYITVRPYCEDEKKEVHRLEVPVKEKIVRPPAIYNNLPGAYGIR